MIIPVPNVLYNDLNKAKERLYEYNLNVKYIHTNEYLPNTVVEYSLNEDNTLNLIVSMPPKKSWTHDDRIAYVHMGDFITGAKSVNKDLLSKAKVGATDLGINIKLNKDTYAHLYGDTFSGNDVNQGYWHSNFIALSKQQNLDNGLTFCDVVVDEHGIIKPFCQGLHNRNEIGNLDINKGKEVTKIPTGGIVLNDTLYVYYMSVRYWGEHGEWYVTRNTLLKANIDDLTNFIETDVSFFETESMNFGQIFPFENEFDDGRIYFVCTPGGRNGALSIMRVNKEFIEDKTKYEVLNCDKNWVDYPSFIKMGKPPFHLIDKNVSEPSIMYNHYLNKWTVTSIEGDSLWMYLFDDLTSKYKDRIKLLDHSNIPSFYGCLLSKHWTKYNDQKIYVQVSQWSPIYNTSMLEIVLK